jgi:hypothetical protein
MKLEADIQCPKCRRTLKIKVAEMHPGQQKKCSCGAVIEFTGDDGREAQRALDDLTKSFKRLSN